MAAIARFRTDAEAVYQWWKKRASDTHIPLEWRQLEYCAKYSAIDATGLPGDLKEAWDDFAWTLDKMECLIVQGMLVRGNFPWAVEGVVAAGKRTAREIQTSARRLQNVGRKYEIDRLGWLAN